MPALKNTRHEIFATLVAGGMNGTEAAQQAGFACSTPDVARNTSYRLRNRDDIDARITELQAAKLEPLLKEFEVTEGRVIQRLAAQAFTDIDEILDFVKTDEVGNGWVILKNLDEIPKHARACIKAIEQAPTQHGMRLKVTLYDGQKALELLGKYLELFVDKSKHTADDELGLLIRELLSRGEAQGARDLIRH